LTVLIKDAAAVECDMSPTINLSDLLDDVLTMIKATRGNPDAITNRDLIHVKHLSVSVVHIMVILHLAFKVNQKNVLKTTT